MTILICSVSLLIVVLAIVWRKYGNTRIHLGYNPEKNLKEFKLKSNLK